MRLAPQRVWFGLIIGLFFLVAGCSVQFFFDFYAYQYFKEETKALTIQPILKKNIRGYSLSATFSYQVDGKNYSSSQGLSNLSFKNKEAAFDAFKKITSDQKVFYTKTSPKKGRLILSFPYKKLISLLTSLFIVGYFVYLRKKVLTPGQPN